MTVDDGGEHAGNDPSGDGATGGPDVTLTFWVISQSADYPGRFVLRATDVAPGSLTTRESFDLYLTLEEARDAVPRGLYRMVRHASDPPDIVETWL